MKKLIMCVAAVLSACALNAATVNWSMANLFNADYESLVGTVTLFSGEFSSTAAIDEGGASGSFSGVTWGTDPFATGSTWSMTAKIQDANGDYYEKVFSGFTLGTITDDDRSNAAAFDGLAATAYDTALPDGTLDITDLAGAGWSAAGGGGGDIPEPTSGLLLLVGGAMLALRRKRA